MHLNNCNLQPNSRYEAVARYDRNSPAVKMAFQSSGISNVEFTVTFRTDAQGRPVQIMSPGPGTEEHPDDLDIQSVRRVG